MYAKKLSDLVKTFQRQTQKCALASLFGPRCIDLEYRNCLRSNGNTVDLAWRGVAQHKAVGLNGD